MPSEVLSGPSEPSRLRPGRLWSLWDMLKDNANDYIELGARIADARIIYDLDENFDVKKTRSLTEALVAQPEARRLNMKGEAEVRDELRHLLGLAERLQLTTSAKMLERRLGYMDSTPQSKTEFDILIEFFREEIAARTFLFVPAHLSKYYEWDGIVSDEVVTAFPNSSEEIRLAGTSLAAGLNTACVFHAMRAAEIGLRALGSTHKITIKGGKPLELAEWREILDGLGAVARDLENLPNSTPDKEEQLQFFSEVAAQFRFFKNGWRVRTAHARASYTEPQAIEALDHVRSFFELLSKRVTES